MPLSSFELQLLLNLSPCFRPLAKQCKQVKLCGCKQCFGWPETHSYLHDLIGGGLFGEGNFFALQNCLLHNGNFCSYKILLLGVYINMMFTRGYNTQANTCNNCLLNNVQKRFMQYRL